MKSFCSIEYDHLSTANYIDHIVNNIGPSSGLRLLLNTNQVEYCGAGKKYRGAGYAAKVHSPEIQPRIGAEKMIRLRPGFHYNIVIKPTIFKRNIEHLKRCRSQMNSILYPTTKLYFKEAWYGTDIWI